MLSDEYPEMGIVGPQALGGTSFSIHLHVDNADAWIERAVAAGATVVRPAADAFYGERSGSVRDPFGHEWLVGHQLEDVSTAGDATAVHGTVRRAESRLSQTAALARLESGS